MATAPATRGSSGDCAYISSPHPPGCPSPTRSPAPRLTSATPRSTMLHLDPALDGRAGQVLMADKGYRSAAFETELNEHGITLIRPTIKSERAGRPLTRFLKPFRQIIESVNQTLKAQLDLERHGGRKPAGVCAASCNDSSLSPPRSGTTRPPALPAPPGHSSPTTTDTPWNQSSRADRHIRECERLDTQLQRVTWTRGLNRAMFVPLPVSMA